MKKKLSIVLAVSLCVFTLLFAFLRAQRNRPDPEVVRGKIRAEISKFVDAFNKGDGAGVAAIYTADARVLPPNQEAISGSAAIQKLVTDYRNAGAKDLAVTTTSVNVYGRAAIEIGTFSMTVGSKTDSGKYVAVWQRQPDDSWKIDIDIWNSNLPVKP
ncbi:MAG TPA: DUF4440 domain-containing protein [Acidobacteriota bacterium]|jgi:uncharacterized protein (TIGR02246 family)